MAKKKIICVLALVLVVCFVWVAQVDAADLVIIYDRSYLYEVLANLPNNTYNQVFSGYLNYNNYNYNLIYGLANVSTNTTSGFFISLNLLPGMVLPSGLIFVMSSSSSSAKYYELVFSIDCYLLDNTIVNLVNGQDFYVTKITTPIVWDTLSYTSNVVYLFTFDESLIFDIGIGSLYISKVATGSGSGYVNSGYYGFLLREDGILYNATYAGSGITPEQYQAIIEGIEDIGMKMEEQNESLFVPAASDTDVILEASSKREQFDSVMNEYSSLNAELERPNVDELLPDYSNVVNGFKDDSFYDSFDVFYGNAYIMFMFLAAVFFATLSYIIFGKKA